MTWMSFSTIRYESCPVKSVFISLFSSCLLPYEHYETCRRRMHLATAIAKKRGGGGKCAVTWQNLSWAFHTRPWAPILHPDPWCQEVFFLFLLGCDVLTQPISLNSDTVHTGVTSLPGILLRTSPSQAVHLYATPDRILISRNCTAFHFLSLFLPSLELKIGSTGRLKRSLR